MMGNEAIARGALEGGIAYCTGYPGNPSSEIIETLFSYTAQHDIVVEWSVNEIVALEAAAAAAFTGLRSIVTMKQNGLNVCADFLTTVSLNKLNGGLLVVVCDDPGPLTSSNEQDSRHFAKIAQIPLLEPSTASEAKEMTRSLLDLSEKHSIPCLLRSVARLSHGRGGVHLGPVPETKGTAAFDLSKPLVGLPFLVTQNHRRLLDEMALIRAENETSPFNSYQGPQKAELLVIATGMGVLQAQEAITALGLSQRAGVLKLGTTWPLPTELIVEHLKKVRGVLFVEEIDAFIEDNIKIIYAENQADTRSVRFYGKNTGDVVGPYGPAVGEMSTDIVIDALNRIFDIEKPSANPIEITRAQPHLLIPRELAFCSGCPHRAAFFAVKAALALDGRNGFVVGDIGCYGLAAGATGYNQIKALHCMGSGMGNLSGFDKLKQFGFDQPVVAVVGDSTFYHAGMPALANAVANDADALFIVLDNSVTAMTGFQINPASPFTGNGGEKTPLRIEDISNGMQVQTTALDPVEDVHAVVDTICRQIREPGVKVIILRRICEGFLRSKEAQEGQFNVVIVDPPRAGLHPKAMKRLIGFAPVKILYVSCNPSTFARDAKELVAAGYRLPEVRPVDMFPHTMHIELASVFSRM